MTDDELSKSLALINILTIITKSFDSYGRELVGHPLRHGPLPKNLPEPVMRPPGTTRNGPQGSLQPPVGCIQALEPGSLLTALSV